MQFGDRFRDKRRSRVVYGYSPVLNDIVALASEYLSRIEFDEN